MSKYASCNIFEFAHHPHAWFHRTGSLPTSNRARDAALDMVWLPNNNVLSMHMVHQPQSDPVIWQYESAEVLPIVYVITEADGTPLYIWEGESRPVPDKPVFNPMVTVHQNGETLVPTGGANVTVTLPEKTKLETLEATVIAASTPTWITGTKHEGMTNENLLRRLFVEYLREANLKPYQTISTALSYLQPFQLFQTYKLLWLRAASQILHDHEGRTAIPIIQNNLTVDSDGLATVV